ncbi:hypothetical protein GCM10022278_16780 [Allohahella marinimesophila]|uniref:LysM domain-containing protein n=2 Tax=Allohahella marinimesophila TaxID=1054972 RepID=A0ABP7P4P5_9GAMM
MTPSESLEMVGKRYLQAPFAWVDLVRHNALGDAFAIPPGATIRIPLEWLRHSPRPATLADTEGTVWVYRRGETRREAARSGHLLNVGDRIKVEKAPRGCALKTAHASSWDERRTSSSTSSDFLVTPAWWIHV